MSRTRPEPGDTELRTAVRAGLEARDRAAQAPRFAGLWPAGRRQPREFLRPAFAAAAAIALAAVLAWTILGRETAGPMAGPELHATAQLAQQLSSPDYWRVPTDDLLAFAAPPLSAELPAPEGFNVSLEESLL